jgi:hypothetical protein
LRLNGSRDAPEMPWDARVLGVTDVDDLDARDDAMACRAHSYPEIACAAGDLGRPVWS